MPLTQPTYYTINGVRFQHASLEIALSIPGINTGGINGFNLGLQSIEYDDGLEPGELRGANPAPLAFTTGKYTVGAKLKIPKAESEFLVQQISITAAANPDPFTGLVAGYGQWQWTATLNYFDIGNPLQTDVLFGARIMKISDSSKVGPEALYVDVELKLLALSRNGYWMVNPALMGAVYGA